MADNVQLSEKEKKASEPAAGSSSVEESKEASSTPAPQAEAEGPSTSSESPEASSSTTPANDDTATSAADTTAADDAGEPKTAWQAIFSPQYNAYYFYNTTTQETTWTNPLEPEAAAEASTSAPAAADPEPEPEPESHPGAPTPAYTALQAAALAQGIDPSLAYLDPSLASSLPPSALSSLPSTSTHLPTFTAKFNARTGQFMPSSSRDPSHLSEFERAKRMSEAYFDVDKWQAELAERGGSLRGAGAGAGGEEEGEGEAGRKRKRPTKKDLERFKEQKKMKKIAKTAWLRT